MPVTDFTLDDIIQQIESPSQGQSSPAGLRFNPFPVTGIGSASETAVISPFEPAISDQVQEFLIAALRSGEFTGMTVIGDFGIGKTHLLRWLEHVINAANRKLHDQLVRAYYVSNPGIRPMDILMSVTKAIGEEDFRKMTWAVVAEDLRQRFEQKGHAGILEAFGEEAQRSLFAKVDARSEALVHPDSLSSLNKFRERYKESFLPARMLRDYVMRVLSKVTLNLDVVHTLTSMLLDDEMRAFASWVSLTSIEGRQQLKVPQQDYFEAILNIIKHNGIGSIFLLIDEFEDVVGWRFSSRQRAEYLATLRLLIDAHVSDFSLVLALIPEAWALTKSIYPAFGDRMGKRVIELGPLNQQRAEELVRRYLAWAREPGNDRTDSLKPFTSDAVRALVQLTEGNTRAFVSACYRVLQRHWSVEEIEENDVRTTVTA